MKIGDNKMVKTIEEILLNIGKFFKAFIYPFATCFFAVLNYVKMREILLKYGHPNWAFFLLVLSIVYIIFTLGFGVYWVIKGP